MGGLKTLYPLLKHLINVFYSNFNYNTLVLVIFCFITSCSSLFCYESKRFIFDFEIWDKNRTLFCIYKTIIFLSFISSNIIIFHLVDLEKIHIYLSLRSSIFFFLIKIFRVDFKKNPQIPTLCHLLFLRRIKGYC